MGILTGYRVLDCTMAMAGPFAALRLGDLGADVIKVEPVQGEWHRFISAANAMGNRVNASFLSLNRNKRSLSVDLKAPQGKEVLSDLVKTADVFLQNYRTGVAERLGIDYPTLSKINPRLVYVSISGYGSSGPYATKAGQDLLLQALSGSMLSVGRETDPPTPAGLYVVDAVTAYNAFEGVLAALLYRERTGDGQLVEVNMLDSIVTLQMQELSAFTVGRKPQVRSKEPHGHVYIRAPYGVFETKDGYIVLAYTPLHKLGETIGEPSFLKMNDETDTWTRRDEIYAKIRERLKTRSSNEWLEAFAAQEFWTAPVYGYTDVVEDPQVKHNGTFVEYLHPTEGSVKTPGFAIKFSKAPSKVERGAPLNGQHTREILRDLNYNDKRIDELIQKRVLAETKL
ncbi:MAG: CoA transferase [Verrucomicrobia bacterium]|nr:CoA transferase [Verrucomicrobiota bacterium]